MKCVPFLLPIALAAGTLLSGGPPDDTPVFRSDVSLARVDVQVLDGSNRAIAGLRAEDFVLREGGKVREIRNFAREDMPLDVLLLFDVSASMGPHVRRIASAAHTALNVLGEKDRVAIMVFDRSTRVRLPFRSNRGEVERELDNMMRQESFGGGTDITRGLLDGADYVRRQGRRDARRAIVILTDDETERDRDEAAVGRALERADAVLSALIAPDAMASRRSRTWSGGGWPGPPGGIILGRRGGYGNRTPGGGGVYGPRTQSAGTPEIARTSGGDSLPVEEASALETTLERLRQRYALHFLLPEGAKPGEERGIEVQLADAARRRYPDSELRFRRVYMAGDGPSGSSGAPAVVTRTTAPSQARDDRSSLSASEDASSQPKRRRPISEPEGPRGVNPAVGDVGQPAQTPSAPADSQQPTGGWRKLKPGEKP